MLLAQTGALNFASLLSLEACATLCHAARSLAAHDPTIGAHGPAAEALCRRAANISAELSPALWDEEVGMFRPATLLEGNLTDVWGSSYAAWLDGNHTMIGSEDAWPKDVPPPTTVAQRERITAFLADGRNGVFAAGQVRVQAWDIPIRWILKTNRWCTIGSPSAGRPILGAGVVVSATSLSLVVFWSVACGAIQGTVLKASAAATAVCRRELAQEVRNGSQLLQCGAGHLR